MQALFKVPVITLLLAGACLAMGTGALAEERPMNGTEIRAALTDKWMRSTDSDPATLQLFLANGVTHYAQGGATSVGRWEVRADQYCSAWPPSTAWDCYDMTQDGPVITFVAKSGRRYSVKLDK